MTALDPLAVAVSYHAGDRGKHGEVVRGYVACGLADHTAEEVERFYRKRSAIETSYRLFRQARATTTTQDPIVRVEVERGLVLGHAPRLVVEIQPVVRHHLKTETGTERRRRTNRRPERRPV